MKKHKSMTSEEWNESGRKARFSNWMATFWNGPPIFNSEKMKFLVYQKEQCPTTDKYHWQAYIELYEEYSLKKMKEIVGNEAHLEPRFGSQEQAIEYCTKEDTRVEDPVKYGIKKQPGKRSDLDSICEAMKSGMTSKEILLEFKGNALRHIGHIQKGLKVLYNLDIVDRMIVESRQNPNIPEAICGEVDGNTKRPPIRKEVCDKLEKELYVTECGMLENIEKDNYCTRKNEKLATELMVQFIDVMKEVASGMDDGTIEMVHKKS